MVCRGCGLQGRNGRGSRGLSRRCNVFAVLSGHQMGFYMSRDGSHQVWRDLKILEFRVCRKDV